MPPSARAAYDAAADIYDDFTAHHDYDGWTALIERLAREHGLAGRRLLDVGCGTGKSFLPFLARGYEVVGCDISPAMLRHARAKCGGRARLVEADLAALPTLGRFDLVLAIDDVLNYLPADALPAAFAGLAANLAPGGVLVFDLNTELTYRTFFADTVEQRRDDGVLRWRGQVRGPFRPGDSATATLEAVLPDRRIVSRHRQHHHPWPTVEPPLRSAGLRCAAALGMDLEGALAEVVDERRHTKVMVVACQCEHATSGSGSSRVSNVARSKTSDRLSVAGG